MNVNTNNGSSAEYALTGKGSDDNSNPQQGTGVNNNRTAVGMVAKPGTPQGGGDRPTTKVPPNKKDARKLFVGGLPSNVTEAEFREFFEQYGTIIDSVVMIDRDTRRSRGFGFVTFEDPAVARDLVNTTDQNGKQVGKVTMRGKVCEVKAAEPRENLSGSGSRRGSRNDRQRPHNKKSLRGPPVMVDNGHVPPHDISNYFPMDHAAIAPGVAPPNIAGGAPWPYGAAGVMVEETPPMFVPGSYGPGVVVPGYYPSPVAPMPPGPAYTGSLQYNPYAAYPPHGPPVGAYPEMVPVPVEGTIPFVPGMGALPNTGGPQQASMPPDQNGVTHDKKAETVSGTSSSEGEETGQA